jgi:hypothetical protein
MVKDEEEEKGGFCSFFFPPEEDCCSPYKDKKCPKKDKKGIDEYCSDNFPCPETECDQDSFRRDPTKNCVKYNPGCGINEYVDYEGGQCKSIFTRDIVKKEPNIPTGATGKDTAGTGAATTDGAAGTGAAGTGAAGKVTGADAATGGAAGGAAGTATTGATDGTATTGATDGTATTGATGKDTSGDSATTGATGKDTSGDSATTGATGKDTATTAGTDAATTDGAAGTGPIIQPFTNYKQDHFHDKDVFPSMLMKAIILILFIYLLSHLIKSCK